MLKLIQDKELLEMTEEEQRDYFEEWGNYIEENFGDKLSETEEEIMDILQRQHDWLIVETMKRDIAELGESDAPEYIPDSELDEMEDEEISRYFKKWSEFMAAMEEEYGDEKSEGLARILSVIRSQMVAFE